MGPIEKSDSCADITSNDRRAKEIVEFAKNCVDDEQEFDGLIKLYDRINTYRKQYSFDLLGRFHDGEKAKFKLIPNSQKNTDKQRSINLSCTAICAYAASLHYELWEEQKRVDHKNDVKFPTKFILDNGKTCSLKEYYNYVIESLNELITNKDIDYDEFTILNTLYYLREIRKGLFKEFNYTPGDIDNNIIIKITDLLIKRYMGYKKSTSDKSPSERDPSDINICYYDEKRHPFIYYRFLIIIRDLRPDKFPAIYREVYKNGKHEMYRQLALYRANDTTRFDVKRLIYSLLIVTTENKYSNNLIKDEVIKLIFKQQYNLGLWPTGQIIKPDFFINGDALSNRAVDLTNKPIESVVISSIECLNDMLMHDIVRADVENYSKNLNSTYEWMLKRIKKSYPGEETTYTNTRFKDKPNDILGWYPEYENSTDAKSWMTGHCVTYIKLYCDYISRLIDKCASEYLHAIKAEDILKDKKSLDWDALADSYSNKQFFSYMLNKDGSGWRSNPDYASVMLYGPPGTGKSTVARSIAKSLKWKYVELQPGVFLEKGEDHIIEKMNLVFKRLMAIKNAVIFFDEVDQLVEVRKDSSYSSRWVVTSLLPKLQDLRDKSDIKFILATNDISKVDPAIMRPGRIDFVLPMGAISWRDRLKMLRNAIQDNENPDKINDKFSTGNSHKLFKDLLVDQNGQVRLKNFDELNKLDRDGLRSDGLKKFLRRTDFVTIQDLKNIYGIFNRYENKDEYTKDPMYGIFFGNSNENVGEYEDSGYIAFHDRESIERMRLPPRIKMQRDKNKIFSDNIFCHSILFMSNLKKPEEIIFKLTSNNKDDKIIQIIYKSVFEMFSERSRVLLEKALDKDNHFIRSEDKLVLLRELNSIIRTKNSTVGIKNTIDSINVENFDGGNIPPAYFIMQKEIEKIFLNERDLLTRNRKIIDTLFKNELWPIES